MRRTVVAAFTALCIGALAAPAIAAPPPDPDVNRETHNGNVFAVVEHPDNSNWFVEVSVDTNLGFRPSGGADPDYVSGFGQVVRGDGAVRVQIENLRVGIANPDPAPPGDPLLTNGSVNDYFVSKSSSAQNNTAAGCARNPVSGNADVTNLYWDSSAAAGCQQAVNTLNSDVDYVGNVVTVRGFGDWLPLGAIAADLSTTCAAGTDVATRLFLSVRWANGDFTRHTVRTANANDIC